jgi:hypothetical protein
VTRLSRLLAPAAAAMLVVTPASAQRCLSAPEAEAIALVAMPEVIRHAGTVCAARLPAASLLRRTDSPLLRRYEAEADRAWPAARAAIVKLSDPAIDSLLQSNLARPLITTLVAPMVVGRVAVEDCGVVDRLVTLLEPLPPRNTAGVLVTALQYMTAEKAKGRSIDLPDLPLCGATR